jgi:hypothetical protein
LNASENRSEIPWKVLKCGLEMMILIDHVKNDEVLYRVKEEIKCPTWNKSKEG